MVHKQAQRPTLRSPGPSEKPIILALRIQRQDPQGKPASETGLRQCASDAVSNCALGNALEHNGEGSRISPDLKHLRARTYMCVHHTHMEEESYLVSFLLIMVGPLFFLFFFANKFLVFVSHYFLFTHTLV